MSVEKLLAKLKACRWFVFGLETQAAEEMLVVERGLTARLREEVDMAQVRSMAMVDGSVRDLGLILVATIFQSDLGTFCIGCGLKRSFFKTPGLANIGMDFNGRSLDRRVHRCCQAWSPADSGADVAALKARIQWGAKQWHIQERHLSQELLWDERESGAEVPGRSEGVGLETLKRVLGRSSVADVLQTAGWELPG